MRARLRIVLLQANKVLLCQFEIRDTQQLVEREVAWLAALQEQRVEEGRAGKATRSLQHRMSARRKRIRELMALWQTWHATASPAGGFE